jgi:CHAT domain-containing protein/tetratricopeptide (TPR) repeat protein
MPGRSISRLMAVALLVVIESAPTRVRSDDLSAVSQQAKELREAGRYVEATEIAQRAVALAEGQFGPEDPKVADALELLGELYYAQNRYADAEPPMQRALAISEMAFGPDHPSVGAALKDLSALYFQQRRYDEAEPRIERALAIAEKALGPENPDVDVYVNLLAAVYEGQTRYAKAEPVYKRALAIAEKARGPEHPLVALYLSNLGRLYGEERRVAEAEPLLNRALAMQEKAHGADHPAVASALDNLALLYSVNGPLAEAEPLFKRALSIQEKAHGPDHLAVASDLDHLASLYRAQWRFTEAEPLSRRALSIAEKALGPEHVGLSGYVNNLAAIYEFETRYADAEQLYKRAIAIREKAGGPDSSGLAVVLNNLGRVYEHERRFADAEPVMKRAIMIYEKAFGPEHPMFASGLYVLATFYRTQGRYTEAEPLFKRALSIDEKANGPDHILVERWLLQLALLYVAQGRYGEAEPLYARGLAIAEKTYGPDHAFVGIYLGNLGALYFAQGDWARAVDYLQRSTAVIIHFAQRYTPTLGEALAGNRMSETQSHVSQFRNLIKAVNRLPSEQRDRLLPAMFQTAQWTQSSEAAQSLTQMAVRGAKGDQKLSQLVRERQDLLAEWQKRDTVRVAAIAESPDRRDAHTDLANVERLTAIDNRIADIDARLASEFPDYAALANSSPLSVEEVQKQLTGDEALVLFLDTGERKPTPEETFIWVVTKTDARWVRSDLGTPSLVRDVAALRCGLDYQGSWADEHCSDLLKVNYTHVDYGVFRKPLPFDLGRAHQFYKSLFAQIEDLTKGKHLLIVPSGSLTQLPFHVLVTEAPRAALPTSAVDYRDVAWLVRRHTITVLPAVSSLKALRELARDSHASDQYIGFGNPLLDGEPDRFREDGVDAMLAREKRCDPTLRQRLASFFHLSGRPRTMRRSNGEVADIADLRRWSPLPETADELCDVARDLGVDPKTHLYLGALATEGVIKRLSADGSLAKYKIVHFATHGAVAGQISRESEPGLLLTPPDKATEADDGYLTASEIASLKFDADWVILSACNTASGEANGAEALSGLARAFFYAGGRSLLVSHWQVASASTVKLITKAIDELKHNPKIGRADALRRSMLSMITGGKDYEAHPAFWAPFVLVGEGGAAR